MFYSPFNLLLRGAKNKTKKKQKQKTKNKASKKRCTRTNRKKTNETMKIFQTGYNLKDMVSRDHGLTSSRAMDTCMKDESSPKASIEVGLLSHIQDQAHPKVCN